MLKTALCLLILIDAERIHFFESLRLKLEKTAQDDYQRFTMACHNARTSFEQKYPVLPEMESTKVNDLQALPVDNQAKQLLPKGWKHVTPLQCRGDGNCLYRYVANMHCVWPHSQLG